MGCRAQLFCVSKSQKGCFGRTTLKSGIISSPDASFSVCLLRCASVAIQTMISKNSLNMCLDMTGGGDKGHGVGGDTLTLPEVQELVQPFDRWENKFDFQAHKASTWPRLSYTVPPNPTHGIPGQSLHGVLARPSLGGGMSSGGHA